VLFAVREGEELLVLASDGGWPVLGAEALRLADAGDLAAARRLLGFAREVAPGDASKPASPGGLLAALLPDDAAAGANAQARHAAAALAAFGDRKGRVAPLLLDARARAPRGAERAALGLALAQAYRAAGRSDALLRLSTELLAEDPASREAFGLQVVALEKLRRRAPLDGAADGILAVLPDDPEVLAVVGNARLALGDPQGARSAFRRLIDAGKASPGVYNNAAWLELFFEPPAPEALEWARKAAGAERALDAAALNTLAAVQATVGQPTDARATFLRSLEAGGGGAPGPADWFVFGRIAEAYGLPEVARAAYARVRPEPEDPTAPNLLARRRLVALGPAPATEPARPATRKPAAAPAPGPKKTPDEKGPPPRKPQRKKPEPDHPERTIPA
jgi:tetratricopeptide (TPR) repeat protein